MKSLLKRIAEWIIFLLTGSGHIAEDAERAGICDLSGQGRDKL